MKSLEERIADRIARKQDAGNDIDAAAFAERANQSDAPTAGTGNTPGAPGAGDAENDLSGNGSGVGADDPLADKTVNQLKAYAEEKGIDLGDATKKADIIAAIQLAEGN